MEKSQAGRGGCRRSFLPIGGRRSTRGPFASGPQRLCVGPWELPGLLPAQRAQRAAGERPGLYGGGSATTVGAQSPTLETRFPPAGSPSLCHSGTSPTRVRAPVGPTTTLGAEPSGAPIFNRLWAPLLPGGCEGSECWAKPVANRRSAGWSDQAAPRWSPAHDSLRGCLPALPTFSPGTGPIAVK
jgi:hypothetical protein